MAKNISFNIKLNVDGKNVLVSCRADAKQLAKQLSQVKTSSDVARQSIMKWGAVSTLFQNAYSGVQQITGVMGSYIQKANAAAESNVKLTTVMRQRMNATQQDVDSINQLISRQKELGVVGGTVQRSGMQQLATFASQRSTLETLLPAMNNLLVQQRG